MKRDDQFLPSEDTCFQYDRQTPRAPEHECFTDREADLYGNLNQVQFHALRTAPGTLEVYLETNAPDFSHYQVTCNGQTRRQTDSRFTWTLARGRNRLEMQVVDGMGNRGTVSSLEFTYLPRQEQN
jgi:hypothetical protein